MPLTEILFVAAFTFGATMVRALFGFAAALILVPILSMRFGVAVASPLVAILSVVMSLAMLSRKRLRLDKHSLAGLLGSAFLGMIPGVLLLRMIPNRWLSLGLAAFILASVVILAIRRRGGMVKPAAISPWWSVPYGFLAGAIMGAYVAGGPPIALYGARKGWEPEAFRDNLQVFFLVASLILVVQYLTTGFYNREILLLAAVAAPTSVAAVVTGRAIAPRISQERFFGVVYLLLTAIAITLILRSVT